MGTDPARTGPSASRRQAQAPERGPGAAAPGPAPDLAGVADRAHDHVRQALRDPERNGARAVAWASAHLVAVDRVVYCAAPDAERRFAARLADRDLQRAVFRFDRRLTGDTHLRATPLSAFADEVLARLEDHVRAEEQVLAELVEVVPPDRAAALAADLAAATATAPTRPHPHTPHSAATRLVSRLDALVDRVRDVLDNRVSSTGRLPVPARPLGRWGGYLMGAGPRTDSDRS